MIEGAFAAFLLVLLISGLFLVLYLSFSKVWVKTALYDGLVCLKEDRSETECRRLVENRLSFLPWGSLQNLRLNKDGRATAEIAVRDRLEMEISQELPEALR